MKSALGTRLEDLLRQKSGPAPIQQIGPTDDDRAKQFFEKGVQKLKAGDYFDAIGPLFAAWEIDPLCFKAGNNLAIAYWHLNCRDLAIRIVKQVLLRDPNNPMAQKHMKIMQEETA